MARFVLMKDGKKVCGCENADGLLIEVEAGGEVVGPLRIDVSGGVLEARGTERLNALTINADPASGLSFVSHEAFMAREGSVERLQTLAPIGVSFEQSTGSDQLLASLNADELREAFVRFGVVDAEALLSEVMGASKEKKEGSS